MGTSSTNHRRRRPARARGLATSVAFMLLFALALGQGSSLIAIANDSVDASQFSAANTTETDGSAEEAPATDDGAAEAPARDDSGGGGGGGDAAGGGGAAASPDGGTRKARTSRSNDANALAAPTPTSLEGGDISLDFVGAGPFTYDHSTGLGAYPDFGFNDRTIDKDHGVVESLESGDFECDDLVTFFTEITVEPDAATSGTIELDYSFGNETTGQPGLGFTDIVSWGINTPDDGNVGAVTDNVVTLSNEHLDTQGYDEVKGTFTITNLAPGETAILRITVRLECFVGSPTGNILNQIEAGRVVSPEEDTISVGQQTVPMKTSGFLGEPAVSIFKDCPDTAEFGTTITYEITITNEGSDDLVDVVVTDTVDDQDPVTLEGFPATLGIGDSFTGEFEYTPDGTETDPLPNRADVSAAGDVTGTVVTAFSECDTDILFPDLAIEKTTETGTVNAGDDISYTITVTNDGEGTAFDVELTDVLPADAGLDWSIDESETTGGWTCEIDTGVLTCGGAGFDLAPEASASVTITSPTTPDTCGTVENDGSAEASNDDQVDSDVVVITVECPDVSVTKEGNGPISAGDTAEWTIVVAADGEGGDAYDVTLSDTLPEGVDWQIDSIDGVAYGDIVDPPCAIEAGELTCDFGTLAAGDSHEIVLSGVADADECPEIENTAQVEASNEGQDVLENNSSTATITVNCGDIVVVKTANPEGPVNAGDTIGFDIVVTNEGLGDADDVELTDALPGGLAWEIVEIDGVPYGDITEPPCAIDGEDLTCDFGTMGPEDSHSLRIEAVTDAADCGQISNTAFVTTSNDGDSQSTDSVRVDCPDVSVTKEGNGPISAGDTAEWTIVVAADGEGGDAYDVTLSDTLPEGVDWQIDSIDGVAYGDIVDPPCAIEAGELTCDFGTLAAGDSHEIVLSGVADADECPSISNEAVVEASNEGQDVLENNSDSATITVNCPSISVVKDADDESIEAGDPIGFTITVSNGGPGVATDVVLTDELPAGGDLDWQIDSIDGVPYGEIEEPPCEISEGVLTCEFGDMDPETEHTVHVSSPTNFEDCPGVDNTAVVTIGNGEGDDDDATVDIDCPPIAIVLDKSSDQNLFHEGDVVNYTFDVSLGAEVDEPLTDIVLTDLTFPDDCDPELVTKTGGNDDEWLEPGEVWSYACQHTIGVGEDDIVNEAHVIGSADDGRTTEDTDDHSVDVIHPGITIVKEVSEETVPVGTTVTYSYTVTNTGDTTLYDISVDDDIMGHIGDIEILDPNQSVTLTKDFVVGEDVVINVGTATGTDVLGRSVTADDDAIVTPIADVNPPPPTPFTGSDAGRLGLISIALLGIGVTVVAATRRRRRTEAEAA